MKIDLRTYFLAAALLALMTLPSIVMRVFEASSLALGVLCGLLPLVYIFLILRFATPVLKKASYTFLIGFFCLYASMLLHGTVSLLSNDDFQFPRFWQSLVLLALCISGGIALCDLARRLTNTQVACAVKILSYSLLFTGLIGSRATDKTVLFYSEPSHYSLNFLPCVLFMVIVSKPRTKLFWLIASFVIAMLLENLTLVVGTCMIALLMLSVRRLLHALALSTLAIPLFAVNLSYYTQRLNLSSSNDNASTLVFLQGWENAYLNFIDTRGWGVGFQQFGIVGRRGTIYDTILKIFGKELNILDGGTTGSKLTGEFGVFGVMLLLVYLAFFLRNGLWLRKAAQDAVLAADYGRIFFLSCFVMYSMDLFVRGTGYFSSTGMLFYTSLVWMASSKLPGYVARDRVNNAGRGFKVGPIY